MYDFIKKLLDSKSTIIIVLWVIVFAWVYTLDYTRKPATHTAPPVGKSLEEIMTYSSAAISDPPWDNEFKSTIRAEE